MRILASMNMRAETALIVGVGWLISLCLHEFAHALVAYIGGDKSVKEKGYLTLNPLRYTDPGLTLVVPMLILMIGGVALPGAAVYIDRSQLRNRFWHSLVSLAGPLANILCLLVLSFFFQSGLDVSYRIRASLAVLALFQTVAILLNLLPFPPLDGFGVIEPWLPRPAQEAAASFGRFGIWIVFLALWFVPPLNRAFWDVAFQIDNQLNIPRGAIEAGYDHFREQSFILMGFILLVVIVAGRARKASSS